MAIGENNPDCGGVVTGVDWHLAIYEAGVLGAPTVDADGMPCLPEEIAAMPLAWKTVRIEELATRALQDALLQPNSTEAERLEAQAALRTAQRAREDRESALEEIGTTVSSDPEWQSEREKEVAALHLVATLFHRASTTREIVEVEKAVQATFLKRLRLENESQDSGTDH